MPHLLILPLRPCFLICLILFFSSCLNRLNREISGGAWCPSKQLNADSSGSEWIQVDLVDHFVITAVATQGRFGNGLGVEFAEDYWIEYSRDNGSTWNKWTDMSGNYVSDFDFDFSCVTLVELNAEFRSRLVPMARRNHSVRLSCSVGRTAPMPCS